MADASSLLSLLRGGNPTTKQQLQQQPSQTGGTAANGSPSTGQSLLHLLNNSITPRPAGTPAEALPSSAAAMSSPAPAPASTSPASTTAQAQSSKPADASELLMHLMGGQLSPPASALPPLSSPHLAPSTSADTPPSISILKHSNSEQSATKPGTPSSVSSTKTARKPQQRAPSATQDPFKHANIVKLDSLKRSTDVQVHAAPVSKFEPAGDSRIGRRTLGWDKALGWITAKTKKLRIINKESGSHFTLKGCDNVIDCSLGASATAGKVVVAAISTSHLSLWDVPKSWQDDKASYRTLASIDFPSDERLCRVLCVGHSIALLSDRAVYLLPQDQADDLSKGRRIANSGDDWCIDMNASQDGSALALLHRHKVDLYRVEPLKLLSTITVPSALGQPKSVTLSGPFVIVTGQNKMVFFAQQSGGWTPTTVLDISSDSFVGSVARDVTIAAFPGRSSVLFIQHEPDDRRSVDQLSEPRVGTSAPHMSLVDTEAGILDFVPTHSDDDKSGRTLHLCATTTTGVADYAFSIPASDDDEGEDEPQITDARRPSLAESIHVETEVAVSVDVMDEQDVAAVKRLADKERPPASVTAQHEQDDKKTPLRVAPVTDLVDSNQPTPSASKPATPSRDKSSNSDVEEPALTAAPQVLPSIKSVPAPEEVFASPRLDAQPLASPGSVSSISPLTLAAFTEPAKASKKATQLRQEITRDPASSDDLLSSVRSIIEAQVSKQARQLEQIRVEESRQSAKRQEELLNIVSTTLSKNTTKLVQSTIQKEIAERVLPSLQKSLDDQVKAAVAEALGSTVTNEIERFLLKPQFAGTLVKNLSTALTPSMERTMSNVIASSIVPTFRSTLQQAVDQVVQSVQQEMVGVRKEIQREQSGSLAKTEEGVHVLQEQITQMRKTIDKMQSSLATLQKAGPATPAPVPSTSSTAPVPASSITRLETNGASSTRRRQVSGPRSPIDSNNVSSAAASPSQPQRSEPKYEQYETMFTNALATETEPAFQGLVDLVDSSPSSRLDRMFPTDGASHDRARVSNAVVCSIAVRLSQALAAGTGPLTDRERVWLAWVARSQDAIDRQDPETQAQLPRVHDWIYSSLRGRETSLATISDLRGAAEIRRVAGSTRAIVEHLKNGR